MARLKRIGIADIPQHIIQRGNNRQVCFGCKKDFVAYLHWLKQYSDKYSVDIHAWVLMTNHVHLLCTPRKPNAISLFMQNLGRRYAQYFNYTYSRTGALWEGRFKSCLIQAESYLLQVYRYIELNPVRASMVEDPANYYWSSYQINGLGKRSTLCTPHQIYSDLGTSDLSRQAAYRSLFNHHADVALMQNLRSSLNKGLALGSECFKAQLEELTGRRLKEGRRGRPVGWRKPKIASA